MRFLAALCALLVAFTTVNADSIAATREERKNGARFATILREGVATFVEIETDEDLDAGGSTDNDSDWDYNDDEDGNTASGNEVYFGTLAISPDQAVISSDGIFSISSGGGRARGSGGIMAPGLRPPCTAGDENKTTETKADISSSGIFSISSGGGRARGSVGIMAPGLRPRWR